MLDKMMMWAGYVIFSTALIAIAFVSIYQGILFLLVSSLNHGEKNTFTTKGNVFLNVGIVNSTKKGR